MLDRGLILGVMLAVAVPAAAQQTTAAATADDPAKPQVEAFEMVLKTAVDRGGQQFAQHASQIMPMIAWSPGVPAIVTGVTVRQLGLYLFEIQVPTLTQTSVQVMRLFPPQRTRDTQPVSNGDRVSVAGGTVQPDPMVTSPAPGVPQDPYDPDRDYSESVKAELINALIDRSGGLPVGPTESIVVVAGGDDSNVPVLYRANGRKLVLSIKGVDLAAFRQGQITRDELRKRITEEHF